MDCKNALNELRTNCPKCKSEDVIIGMDESGYFWFIKCNKCSYKNE